MNKENALILASAGLIAALAILLLFLGSNLEWRERARSVFERMTFVLNPSAARAFAYGERHFSARDSTAYDIDRAEYFFNEAKRLGSDEPYLHHELARVAFIRGDLGTALWEINAQVARHGTTTPNSYYVRGLVEGYMGDYEAATKDYEKFLSTESRNWAAVNDYAWVLLKADRAKDAAKVTTEMLKDVPGNPWLLNTNAIALYEIGNVSAARASARAALEALKRLNESQWLIAYPGNDPRIAREGITTFQSAAIHNMHIILTAQAPQPI